MKRNILAILVATALAAALSPVAVASASAAASAELAEDDRTVFPGDGQGFSVSVRNDERGVVGSVGAAEINWVRIILPASRGFALGSGSVEQDGWEVIETRTERSQSLTFTGGAIAGGGSETFAFPVDVARPADSDVNGPFQVMVSSDGGETAEAADGPLTSLVRILEVLDGTVVAPALAADGSASAGQEVDYGVRLRNHAARAVSVEADLEPLDGDVVRTRPAARMTAPGGEAAFVFGLRLADDLRRDSTHRYDAGARTVDGGALAGTERFEYRVQVPPVLEFDENTFAPRFVRPESLDYRFTAEFTKRNTPSATIRGGTLSFADTNVAIDVEESDATWGTNTAQRVVTERTEVAGEDGDHPVIYRFSLVDGNGFAFDQEIVSVSGQLVTIDGIAPVLRELQTILPMDEDGARQIRAKDGDRIAFSGEIEDRNADPEGIAIVLRIPGADDVEVPQENISTSEIDDGLAFEAFVEPAFGVNDGEVGVEVEAIDLAGNTGHATGVPFAIDNIPPQLGVQGFTILDSDYDDQPVLEVVFDENFNIRGGCNPSLYQVDGELLVRDVLFSNGEPCRAGEPDPAGNNIRILRLLQERDRAHETTVQYEPGNAVGSRSDRIKDGAGHFADEGVQEIINQIAPPLPTIDAVLRNGGDETAVFDDGRYWTRFGGEDLRVRVSGAGVRSGDRLEARDAQGNVLRRSEPAAEDNDMLSVVVPIGQAEDAYTRSLRLVSVRGVPGEDERLTVELDRTAPDTTTASRIGDSDEVEVTFSEILWDGTNFASDWRAYEDDDGDLAEVGVRGVDGSGDTRLLDVAFQDFGPFAAAEYLFQPSGNNRRYEDRAGNLLPANVFQPAAR